MGNYILDFYCASKKIAIELDGTQHFEDIGREKDALRDNYLNERGIKVLRYSNKEVNQNFSNVWKIFIFIFLDNSKREKFDDTSSERFALTFPSRGRLTIP